MSNKPSPLIDEQPVVQLTSRQLVIAVCAALMLALMFFVLGALAMKYDINRRAKETAALEAQKGASSQPEGRQTSPVPGVLEPLTDKPVRTATSGVSTPSGTARNDSPVVVRLPATAVTPPVGPEKPGASVPPPAAGVSGAGASAPSLVTSTNPPGPPIGGSTVGSTPSGPAGTPAPAAGAPSPATGAPSSPAGQPAGDANANPPTAPTAPGAPQTPSTPAAPAPGTPAAPSSPTAAVDKPVPPTPAVPTTPTTPTAPAAPSKPVASAPITPADPAPAAPAAAGKPTPAAPAPAAPAAAAPAALTKGTFAIQVASLEVKEPAKADEFAKQIQASTGLSAQVVKSEDGQRLRVYAGRYPTKEGAQKACEELKKRKGFENCFVKQF